MRIAPLDLAAEADLELPPARARRALADALGALVVVHIETTGREPDESRIVEIGAIRVEADGSSTTFEALVDPGAPLPESTRELTLLTDADVAGRPAWNEVGAQFREWARGAKLVAHDVEFVRDFLRSSTSGTATWLDTLELAYILRPELPAHDLGAFGRELGDRVERHRGLPDAAATLAILVLLHDEVRDGEHDELVDVLTVVERQWGWSRLFGLGGADDLGPLGRAARRGGRGKRATPAAGIPSADEPPVDLPDAPDLATLLADEERFGREIPGYRLREGQVEFTEAIAEAFRDEKALAIEAGTGIGKTLGYGLVAFLHAASTGERVIVSSANRTLQERVVAEELPAIARALGVPPLPAVVMKGRGNYGSPSRARDIALGVADVGLEGLSAAARLFLVSYFTRCPHRDLQAFGAWLAARDSNLLQVRERIACSGDCDVRVCRSEPGGACGYLSRVDALGSAGVVSINHSLLLSWPARYGSIERLVIDEAHELVGEGDRAFAENLQARDLRGALRRVRTHPKRGLVGVLAVRAGRRELLDSIDETMERIDIAIDDVGARLVATVGDQETTVPSGTLLPPEGPWVDLKIAVERLVAHVSSLASMIDEVAPSDVGGEEDAADDPREDAIHREAAGLARFFQSAAGGVLGDLFVQAREDHVYAGRGYQKRDSVHEWSFTVTPLDAAELIHARVLESPKTLVALSATLGVGGDPGPTLAKLGWGCLPRDRRMPSLVLPSPFDFANHAVLGLVRGSTYRDSSFEDDCAQTAATVARMLGGRTMALFTSRRRLYEVARRLREELHDDDIPLFVQPPTGGAAALVERFVANPRSVLLGTRSLWQGVDIRGDALSCVLIDKFPFPQPNDPLLRGRQDRLRAAGEDAFRALSIEPAVVLFKQMFGRLVRSETDRGFVVVLGADPTKRYVRDFVTSLPGPPRVLVDEIDPILEEMQAFFDLKVAEAGR